MKPILRVIRYVAATVLALSVGTVASCSTMGGGGGMHYLVDPLGLSAQETST
jgi:hypothetical protein